MDVVESKCHTPFCRKDCQTVHHGLIRALCIERNRKESKPRLSSAGNSHVILRQCVQLYEDNGWNRNSSVPDDLPDLRKPLVYLTCAFGKHRVLETLLSMNFDPSVVTRDGENGLHGLVNHFYRVGNMKQCGGFMVIDKRLEVFEKVVRTLSTRDPNVFSAKENRNGRTPLHVVALSVVSCSNGDARVDGRCDPLKKTRYFQRCLEVMVGHLLELKSNSLITLSQLSNAIMAQDNDGNTIIHILAKSSCVPSWESIGKVLKDFPDSELPLMKNKESKTAFDLLSSLNMEVARKLFFPEDYHEGRVDESITGTVYNYICLLRPVAILSAVGRGGEGRGGGEGEGGQCGPVVRQSGDPRLKTRSDHSLNLFLGSPWFNFPAALVNSQLVFLRPVGILNSCSVLSFRPLCIIGPEKPLSGAVIHRSQWVMVLL